MTLAVGQRFGRLIVLRRICAGKHPKWWMQCDCGSVTAVDEGNLKRGLTRSCGCLNLEKQRERNLRHGGAPRGHVTVEYRTWQWMRSRCLNKNDPRYKDYGGRGVTIDPHWDQFENFLEDMGRRPGPGYSIERKNNELGYLRGNCVWATRAEQAINKRNNTLLTHAGRTQTLGTWAKELEMKSSTLSMRLKRGWSVEKTLTAPKGAR